MTGCLQLLLPCFSCHGGLSPRVFHYSNKKRSQCIDDTRSQFGAEASLACHIAQAGLNLSSSCFPLLGLQARATVPGQWGLPTLPLRSTPTRASCSSGRHTVRGKHVFSSVRTEVVRDRNGCKLQSLENRSNILLPMQKEISGPIFTKGKERNRWERNRTLA